LIAAKPLSYMARIEFHYYHCPGVEALEDPVDNLAWSAQIKSVESTL